MRLCSIDPGARKLGVAEFIDGVLTEATTLEDDEDMLASTTVAWIKRSPLPTHTVTERMHKRPGQTLFDDALDRVEAVRMQIKRKLRGGFKRTYNPTEWKGSIPK